MNSICDTTIGIVVLNYNTWQKTINCINSIINTYKGKMKIVIVDNCSQNQSFEKLKSSFSQDKYSDIHVIKSERNGGFSYGNNFGYRYISEHFLVDYVVFSNNDVIFETDTIRKLIEILCNNSRALAAAPLILDLNNQPMSLPWKSQQSFSQYLGIRNGHACLFSMSELRDITQVYMVSGCCFAVSIKLFRNIGLFDENVFLYNEEGILSRKAKEAGYSIWFAPMVSIIHDHGASTGNSNIFVDKEIIKSGMYYWRNYEKARIFTIIFLWLFWITRMYIKKITRKYADVKNYSASIKETFYHMIFVISGKHRKKENTERNE